MEDKRQWVEVGADIGSIKIWSKYAASVFLKHLIFQLLSCIIGKLLLIRTRKKISFLYWTWTLDYSSLQVAVASNNKIEMYLFKRLQLCKFNFNCKPVSTKDGLLVDCKVQTSSFLVFVHASCSWCY